MNWITTLLILFVFYEGIRELTYAMRYCKEGSRKWAISSALVGVFALICGVLAIVDSI